MCGIIGVFGKNSKDLVAKGLELLNNRGKDGKGMVKSGSGYLGHTLHRIVGNVKQPLSKGGIITANCEIYNWQKISSSANNDAEALLNHLERKKSLEELDGVYAFGYYKNKTLTLARDILGVKPLWFFFDKDWFAFSSEKKVLEKLGFLDVKELNPRMVLTYREGKLKFKVRLFFKPKSLERKNVLEKLNSLLQSAIDKRIPKVKFGLLFSGGIDSTYIAYYLKKKNIDFTCYTAVLDSDTEAKDYLAAKEVAKELNLKLKIIKIKKEEIPKYLKTIIPLIEDSNVVKVGVALPFFLASKTASKDGCKVIFSGLGSEEIFAGYERHKASQNINKECISGLLKLFERDLYRDDVITMFHSIELRLPFLDKELVKFALEIPGEEKIKDGISKFVLRQASLKIGLSEKFAMRKKYAAQYGSRFDNALGKLAKPLSKSEYLKQFYPDKNLNLGVLFSSGKDSCMASFIMAKQNYNLSCLITMKSKNPDSYMFQSAGVEMVEQQANLMSLPIILHETKGKKEEELKDLEEAIRKAKEKYKVDGIVSGAMFSNYQRDRIEKICDKLGLKMFCPLWHKPQIRHMEELVEHKFKVILTKVACDGLDESFLGREVDEDLINDLKQIKGINIAGEGGEFESLVLWCPLFKEELNVKYQKMMETDCSGSLVNFEPN
jgi:diphthine-ammonia ligase